MKAAPVCTTSPTYPSSFIPAIFRHQCSSHKHPVKSVVLLRQSAAHNQLFIFAPSITQFILKKKKHLLFSGIYKYLPQFSLLITKSVTKAYSTLCTNSTQIHKGAIIWHTAQQHQSSLKAAVSLLRGPPASNSEKLQVSHAQCHK